MNRRDKVTPSCGCVFCDIGLRPDGDGWHKLDFGRGKLSKAPSTIKCTNHKPTDTGSVT
jgi:hypothetical protein